MKLFGGITNESGVTASIRAMHLQSEIVGISNDNIMGFDKIGYQRKEAVVSSFAEYLGVHGLSTMTDDSVGRIALSKNPLDFAISEKGYFQVQGSEGIKLTRDGRFRLDKEGYLLTNENEKVLANNGTPVKFSTIPKDLKEVKVDANGKIAVYDPEAHSLSEVATLSVVTDEGIAVIDPNVRQGYNEFSNVQMASEFMRLLPAKQNFEANRRMFVIQNSSLTKIIERLSQG